MLLISGLLLIMYPKWNTYMEERRELQLLTEWDAYLKENSLEEQSIQTAQTTTTTTNKAGTEPKLIDGIPVHGTIAINKIDLREPIVEGATPQSLKVGSGSVVPGRAPGEIGNYVLASHRSLKFGRHYNRLDELAIGDSIQVETADRTFTYTVRSKSIVTPEDLSVLDQNPHERELTLITCDPIDTATHRLIVKAFMEEEIHSTKID
ncbi:class D sortase [Paenibacillus agilis]|uniref:Class D sortase n=2 Tax=Paenibacillus agilis TaxID=3020863 RepID=A0A559ILQ5_9BACL|nr:class D sortase [Paenibacillus agilis]